MFKFRDKYETIGIFLGTLCFVPSFFIALTLGIIKSLGFGLLVLVTTQCLWLTSMILCTRSVEIENRQLKEKLQSLLHDQ